MAPISADSELPYPGRSSQCPPEPHQLTDDSSESLLSYSLSSDLDASVECHKKVTNYLRSQGDHERPSRRRRRNRDALAEEFIAAEPEPRRRAPLLPDLEAIPLSTLLPDAAQNFIDPSSPVLSRTQTPIVVDLTNEDDAMEGRPSSPGLHDFPGGYISFPLLFSQLFGGIRQAASRHRNIDQRDHSSLMSHYGAGYWKRRREAAKSKNPEPSASSINLEEDDEIGAPTSQQDSNDKPSSEPSEPMLMDVLTKMAENGQQKASATKEDSLFKNFKCLVCLDTVVDPTSTFCGHVFCEECILSAIRNNQRCPACRCKLTPNEIHPLFV